MRRLAPLVALVVLSVASLPAPSSAEPSGHILLMEWAPWDVAVDGAGNAYVVGEVWVGSSFDAALRKIDASQRVVWTVTFGGEGSDYPRAVAVGPDGNVYVAGTTWSAGFPHSSGSFRTGGGPTNVFFSKWTPNGALIHTTSFGGSSSEEVTDIGVGPDNAPVIVGTTWSCDFPTTSGALDRTRGGSCDAFLSDGFALKLKADTTGLVYSTYLGGAHVDEAAGVAVSPNSGSALVAGITGSTDFPTTSGAYQRTYRGGGDGFVVKLSSTGGLAYGTYLGGTGEDRVRGLARDASSRPYVVGSTWSADYPVTPSAFQTRFGGALRCSFVEGGPDPVFVEQACPDAFVTRLSSTLSSLDYSTYIGTEYVEQAMGVGVDDQNFAYVTGFTNSTVFPQVESMLGKVGAADIFLVSLTPNGRSLAYSAMTGSSINDIARSVVALRDGRSVHVGAPGAGDFTNNTRTQPGADDGYVIRMGDPSDGIFFDVRGGHRDWVEVFLGGRDGGRVVKLEGRDSDSATWTPMSKQVWGWWAGPVHNDIEDSLQFRATLDDGTVVTSCFTAFDYHSCVSRPPPSGFEATFTNVKGNEWWIQASVSAQGGVLSKVEVSLDHGSWKPLANKGWGWAASYHAPEGTIVQLRATSTEGATDLSECYRWVSATLVDCGSGGGVPPGEEPRIVFDHKGGNEWWVEVKITGEDASLVSTVIAFTSDGEVGDLSLRWWGNWAGSFHIRPGQEVRFEALGESGLDEFSCWFSHPQGVERCDEEPQPPPPQGGFDATFANVRGNAWWVETDVSATGGTLAGVDARVNGGSWIALTKQSWGSWAKSIHVPSGSLVEFRARATDGATDVSGAYRWPPS